MGRRRAGVAALIAAAVTAVAAAVNYLFCPGYLWFYSVVFAVLWFPLAAALPPGRHLVGFALAGSAATAVYLVAVNLLHSPGTPWFLYTLCPLAFWPVAMRLGKKLGVLAVALVCSALIISYYVVLNVLVSPGFPWAVCVAFTVIWWPMSMVFARHRQWVGYAFAGAALTILFLFTLNIAASQGYLWFVFPSLAILWWPLSVLFAKLKKWFGYSVAGALLFSASMITVNVMTSPGTIWAVYPIFAVLWWPLAMYFFSFRRAKEA